MKFYRYEIQETSSMMGFAITDLKLITFNLHRETPKGYWIGHGQIMEGYLRSTSKWVSKTGRKRYAYPTKEQAMHNFMKRTEKRKEILKSQLEMVEDGLRKAKILNMTAQKFYVNDIVKLPHKSKGRVVEYHESPWASKYVVEITESDVMYDVGELHDFFEKHLELDKD